MILDDSLLGSAKQFLFDHVPRVAVRNCVAVIEDHVNTETEHFVRKRCHAHGRFNQSGNYDTKAFEQFMDGFGDHLLATEEQFKFKFGV